MSGALSQHLATIQEDFNRRLDELELKLISISDSTMPNLPSFESNADSISSNHSSSSMDSPLQSEFADVLMSDLPNKFESNPEEVFTDIINFVRRSLAKKASTKRLIEKANAQYVDLSFQRVSIQLTAFSNQKILQEHNNLDVEINGINSELDALKDHMESSFEEIKGMIKELVQLKEDMEQEAEMNKLLSHDMGFHGRSSHTVPLLRRGVNLLTQQRKSVITKRKKPVSLLLAPTKAKKE